MRDLRQGFPQQAKHATRKLPMLAVISDLHLSDGTTCATIAPGAFEIFAQRLADTAYAASWRASGQYKPIERIDLVLLGDVLDLIRSSAWQQTKLRPWSDLQTETAAAFLTELTRTIVNHNQSAFEVLRDLAAGGVQIPLADARGKPVKSMTQQPFTTAAAGCLAEPVSDDVLPIPVRIHYLVGNHDWMFHLPGARYSTMRSLLVSEMGLANRADVPFPHDANESPELLEALRRHRVLLRHGDIYDPMNFDGDRDRSSLGDAIVIDLLTKFATEVQRQTGEDLPPALLVGMRELDNVRPLMLVPVWLSGMLERSTPIPGLRTKIKRIWDSLVDDFLALDLIRKQDTWNPAEAVDGLQHALKFSKRLSLNTASAVGGWLSRMRAGDGGSYARNALAEPEFRNRRAKHIVYGHTHSAETIPLDASFADSFVLNQVYFNSGTWRRVHRPTCFDPSEQEFIPTETMTYLTFFEGDQRSGRPFETWSGTLALSPNEVASLRLDDAHRARMARPHAAPKRTPLVGPHFGAATIPSIVPGRV
jgi:UDP-2,3-diacylglucosamine pyrophosphatase LpxH